MLEARIRGFFKQRVEVDDGGVRLTELQHARREGTTFTLGAEQFEITRGKRRHFTLAGPRGSAEAELSGSRRWTITTTADGGGFELVRPQLMNPRWEVRQGGQTLGTIKAVGLGRRIQSNATLPAPLHLFAVYLVIVVVRRSSAAAAGSSG